MTDYYYAGVRFESLFAPDTVGDGPAPGGLLQGGVPIRFANIKYGSKRADINFQNGGLDVTNYWASNGSASYSLPIDGGSYSANNQQRGGAYIRLQMFANGTYQVLRMQNAPTSWSVAASGTWLPAGDAAGNYAVVFEAVEQGHSYVGSASSGVENQAPGQTGLGGNPYCSGYCSASLTGTRADSHGYLRLYLYRAGVLRSTTTISYWCNVNGN
ncbi:hypothetical protein [Luteibacter sp.]|uniref:hypothetical protein n=1 Tax=Luteibacter sp. TaxID=1886636 RepID=UPI002F40D6E3